MRDLTDILPRLRAIAPELKSRYAIRELAVFGSYARGEQRDDSDLDVLVDFHEVPGIFTYTALQQRLSEELDIRVDLVMGRSLRPRLARRVNVEKIVL